MDCSESKQIKTVTLLGEFHVTPLGSLISFLMTLLMGLHLHLSVLGDLFCHDSVIVLVG